MLNIDDARKIGINACIDRLGREFVSAHRDCATSAYGENDGGVFCFVGIDDGRVSQNRDGMLVLDDRAAFPYRASCNVSLRDGFPVFIECITPTPSQS